ncbi:ATP-dependent helicase HrpB [Simiduia curdlanivorans]|uniref:ATP-dependent helicase HrpB n=1 Tax=Simiduia curdlanivorans TaxID=1492769 RepID=A0ABV8V7S8_9GAMM|nr:ATP-dependent helicase HrpB [Simiduia curdlanivorans]MDN3640685.1 ATP-dependent helicase HrpB [Simiduia curdlanivorans]
MHVLPINAVLPDLLAALRQSDDCILEAPPGAGKTTYVPLALLTEAWLKGQKILLLEPRRLAARAAASRMASLLNEAVGEQVGFRVRMESKISRRTRIEVVTEGILTRMLQDDPSLEGYGIVVFDEFHERSLDGDLGLALALMARDLYGDLRQQPLKLLLMSATLDGQDISRLLDSAPIIRSEGRSYPIQIHYSEPWQFNQDLVARIVAAIFIALQHHDASVLVFLPGQSEIRRVADTLSHRLGSDSCALNNVMLAPLFGDLSLDQQRQAIEPCAPGFRKIVLATNIAETSLTIDGVDVVIDSGLYRQASFNPNTGLTHLVTKRISKASSTQRAGRAGRLAPGVCYRLWSETQQQELAAFTPPEIEQSDLSPLALQLFRWGVTSPAELRWLTPPPTGAWQQAVDLLLRLQAVAVDERGVQQITEQGRMMSDVPAHPRLAHMLVCAQALGQLPQAALIAALLSERDVNAGGADVQLRLDWLKGDRQGPGGVAKRLRQLASQFERALGQRAEATRVSRGELSVPPDQIAGLLLAFAFPDRIAQRRSEQGHHYRLSNGRSAVLAETDSLRSQPWLVVAETGGHTGERIFLAAALAPSLFDGPLKTLVRVEQSLGWDNNAERFVAEQRRCVGALILASKQLPPLTGEAKQQALLQLVRDRGLGLFEWSEAARQLRARVMLVREHTQQPINQSELSWPDFSDTGLLNNLNLWLAPYVDKINKLQDFKALDLHGLLCNQLDWHQQQALNQLAPSHWLVPSGNAIAIDYDQSPPVLAVKLQEMFGCEETPALVNGKVTLLLHLLSPARRPIQITQDIAGFWRGSYQAVKKDMKGRYSKHPWPDDPLQAIATAKVKNKM